LSHQPPKLTATIQKYMETDKYQGYALSTRRTYERSLAVLAEAAGEDALTRNLSPDDVNAAINHLRHGTSTVLKRPGRESKSGQARSEHSLNIDRTAIRTFVEWCRESGYMDPTKPNPALALQFAQVVQTRRFDDLVLTRAEAAAAIMAADERHPRDRLVVALGLFGGLRMSEMRNLRWQDINWLHKELNFLREKTRGNQAAYYTVGFNGSLKAELLRWQQYVQTHYGAIDPKWYVCPARAHIAVRPGCKRPKMEPMWPVLPHKRAANFLEDIHAVLTAIGKPKEEGQGAHVLRRTFANILREDTGDIRNVTIALGHKNQATTEKYLHRNREADRLKAVYEQMDQERGSDTFGLFTRPGDNVVEMFKHRRKSG
jgi:integrase